MVDALAVHLASSAAVGVSSTEIARCRNIHDLLGAAEMDLGPGGPANWNGGIDSRNDGFCGLLWVR